MRILEENKVYLKIRKIRKEEKQKEWNVVCNKYMFILFLCAFSPFFLYELSYIP